jgi:hypothetical protein
LLTTAAEKNAERDKPSTRVSPKEIITHRYLLPAQLPQSGFLPSAAYTMAATAASV